MSTINISLPDKLKDQAEELVKGGFFVSFSDLVRHSLREVVVKNKYDLMTELAMKEEKEGKATVLKTKKDIKKYFDNL